MRSTRAVAFWALAIMAGCAMTPLPVPFTAESPLPARSTPLLPVPDFYRTWWAQVERCAKHAVPMTGVRYYVVIGDDPGFYYHGMWLAGYAYFAQRAIALGEGFVLDSFVVRHEQLHLIAPRYYGHDPAYFQDRCRALVSCTDGCLTDAGPTKPRN